MVRFDVFWIYWNASPIDFYDMFWKFLDVHDITYYPHWGKYLPGDMSTKVKKYSKFGDFCEVRKKFDPKNVFLSDYWSQKLGIPF